jgi:hypothetical protein
MTLEISRAVCNIDVTAGTLTATDTCIGYHVTWFEASQKVTHCCYAYRLYFLTCDKYKSSLRHIHDPVLLSLKMKGIHLLLFIFF